MLHKSALRTGAKQEHRPRTIAIVSKTFNGLLKFALFELFFQTFILNSPVAVPKSHLKTRVAAVFLRSCIAVVIRATVFFKRRSTLQAYRTDDTDHNSTQLS